MLRSATLLSSAKIKSRVQPWRRMRNYDRDQEVGNHSAEFQKGYRNYFGVRVQGTGGLLQGSASDVLLYIPKGLQAFVYGYIHTNPWPFRQHIPEDHCLVAPIVEYHYHEGDNSGNRRLWFKIKVPHCVTKKEDLKSIQVLHGDIHRGISFSQLSPSNGYFQVDEKYVTIYTRRFSQFICTSCNKICNGKGKAFIFGKVTARETMQSTADLRLYLCSPLHNIRDYRTVSI